MRTVAMLILLIATVGSANAWNLDADRNGCDCMHNAYIVNWSGPWPDPRIVMMYGLSPYQFYFYAGYLAESGQVSSPMYDTYYSIWACTGSECPTQEMIAQVYVPWENCDPED